MKKSDKMPYHQKNIVELNQQLASVRKQLVEARIKHGGGQLKDTSVFKKLKYQISLILTIIKQKQNDSKQE